MGLHSLAVAVAVVVAISGNKQRTPGGQPKQALGEVGTYYEATIIRV